MAEQPKEAYLNQSYYGPTIPADQPTQGPRIPEPKEAYLNQSYYGPTIPADQPTQGPRIPEPKEAYLNQSYYGPTIPADQPTQRPRIPSTMQQCSPYALLCHAFKALTIVIIVLGITVLTLWLIYTPQPLKVYVESANLTRFDLNDSSLFFNLYANLTVRNPNKRGEIYYKHVQATAFYDGAKLEDIILPLFHQQKKNTTAFDLSYIGGPLKVGPSVNVTYGREKEEGWFYLGLKFYTKVRLRMIIINSVQYTPEGDCQLRLPVHTNETSMKVGFQRTKCHVDQFT